MPGPQGRGDRTEAMHVGIWNIVSAQQCNTMWTPTPTLCGRVGGRVRTLCWLPGPQFPHL